MQMTHHAGRLPPVRAAHPPRRTRQANRRSGHHRWSGCRLRGDHHPPGGPLRRRRRRRHRDPPAGPERRVDGGTTPPPSPFTRAPPSARPRPFNTRLGMWPGHSAAPTRPHRGRSAFRVPASSSGPIARKKNRHEPRSVHRHLQGRHCPAGGGVLPAPVPAVRDRPRASSAAPLAARGAGGRHPRRGPLTPGAPRHHHRRRDGDRQVLHRRGGRPRGGLPAGAGPVPTAPDPQVEARGGGDGARRPGRHRRLHHRPGKSPPLERRRAPLRRHVPRARQALVPLAARRRRALGRRQRPAGAGREVRRAVPRPLLPGLRRPDRGHRRRAADGPGAGPAQAPLPALRRAPLAGRRRPAPGATR